jgi:hypothetical protein
VADTIVTIYMPLANEAAEYRPVKAVRQREDLYCVLGPVEEGEEWKFPPGSMVKRKARILPNGKEEMVAIAP